MDWTQLLTQVFGPLISIYGWLIPLFFLLSVLKTRVMKGVFGEFKVNLAARLFLDKRTYTLFENVTFPTIDGSTQIDHIVVSRYGVFVIETKNMKGWIYGSPQQKTWPQKIHRHTTSFQNPLHQNYKHTQTLQAALNLDSGKVFSVVVFVGDSTFKTPMPDNVVHTRGYIRYIKNKVRPVLSESDVVTICGQIQSGRLKPSIRTHLNHVKHVKAIVEAKQRQEGHSCAKCGKPMVLRTARNGDHQGKQFWGCSGYPKCRMTRQVV